MEQNYSVHALQMAGAISLALGIGHLGFHRLFRWRREFERITDLNTRVFTTLHAATLLFLIGAGALTLRYAALLSRPDGPAPTVCLTLFLFWGWRLVWQIAYFRPSKIEYRPRLLWVHYVLVLLFALLALGYGLPLAAVA